MTGSRRAPRDLVERATPARPGKSGQVRVTVASSARRVDLVLPAAIPVAELVPELARSVGLLDPETVHGGYRLVTADGRRLAPDVGLGSQGVDDGTLLGVVAGVDEQPPRVHDDVVEAMAEVVGRTLRSRDAFVGRSVARGAVGLLMCLGAVAVLTQRGGTMPAASATVVAVGLVAGAVVLSRVRRDPEAAVVAGWTGCAWAAVAGLMLVVDEPLLGAPVAAAGAGAVLAGLACLVGLGESRGLMIPAVVVGAVSLATGLLHGVTALDPAVLLTAALVVVVLAGGAMPGVALAVTGAGLAQLCASADVTAEPADVHSSAIEADARVAHEVLLALSTTTGLLLVAAAPFAVRLGAAGTVLAVVACTVVLLRTRQHRSRAHLLVGLASGVLGLASTAVAALWSWPQWRPVAAVVLTAAGSVLFLTTLARGEGSARRGRLAEVVETLCLLAVLPLLVVATGLLATVAGR